MRLFDIKKRRSAAQKEIEHPVDAVANGITPKCSSCGIEIPSARTQCVSCEWAENKSSSNKEVFKMVTKDGQLYNFTYLGHTRFHPNRASACGYGSDDWLYLCEANGRKYILMFSDDASCGPGWMCTELRDGDFEKLTQEDVNFWGSVAHAKERNKVYTIHLTEVDSIRHLLPTNSRCGKLTDESFMR